LGFFFSLDTLPAVDKNIHTDDQQKLADMLKEARTAAGLTQAQLSEKIGVPQSFVSKYESGERRLDILELRTVCRALGVSLGAFVNRLDKELS
jgi:transcriptional regulator with XRE-family HTH domain